MLSYGHNIAEFCFLHFRGSVPNVRLCVNPAAYSRVPKSNACLVFATNTKTLKSPNNAALDQSELLTRPLKFYTKQLRVVNLTEAKPASKPSLSWTPQQAQRFPLSLQQYLREINTSLFVCFSLSFFFFNTTEKLLSTRKQATFPPSDQKSNNLPQKFTNQTAFLLHILLSFKTRCVCTSAVGTMAKAQEGITCWCSCMCTAS